MPELKSNTFNRLRTSEDWASMLHSVQTYQWKIPRELASHLKQGVLKPPPLMKLLVERFTPGKFAEVFDPFAGEGGILVGAAMAECLASGCDLYMENKETAAKVGEYYGFPPGNWWGMMGEVDAIDWLRWLIEERGREETQDLLLTDPPFGINHGRTLDQGGSVPVNLFSHDDRDIGTLDSWEKFYKYIGQVAYYSEKLLKPGGYALWWLGDRFRGGHYRVVGAEAQPYIEESGLVLKGVQHWIPKPLNVRRQVFGWGKFFSPLVDHSSLWIYLKPTTRQDRKIFRNAGK